MIAGEIFHRMSPYNILKWLYTVINLDYCRLLVSPTLHESLIRDDLR